MPRTDRSRVRLADLAEEICRGENSDRLFAVAQSAMQVGHTSGMDAVTGLLVGLVAWEVQSPVISYGSGAGGMEHGSIKS